MLNLLLFDSYVLEQPSKEISSNEIPPWMDIDKSNECEKTQFQNNLVAPSTAVYNTQRCTDINKQPSPYTSTSPKDESTIFNTPTKRLHEERLDTTHMSSNRPNSNDDNTISSETYEDLSRIRLEPEMVPKSVKMDKNPISALQELCVSKGWSIPTYSVVAREGPDHMLQWRFEVAVKINGNANSNVFRPKLNSSTKQKAKADAAWCALRELNS